MKKTPFILLGILILIHLAVPIAMIQGKETILRDGQRFKFKTRPIDPVDPFQGRYVWLAYENDYIATPEDAKTDLNYKDPIYAIVESSEDGFAHFTGWSREKPTSGHFLKTRYMGTKSTWDRDTQQSIHHGMQIDLPFDRFYMDEAKAPRAEAVARNATRNTNCWAEVRILHGKAVIEDVFAEGQSLRKLVAKKDE
jgi:uncharacterized membrane-anchored protein